MRAVKDDSVTEPESRNAAITIGMAGLRAWFQADIGKEMERLGA